MRPEWKIGICVDPLLELSLFNGLCWETLESYIQTICMRYDLTVRVSMNTIEEFVCFFFFNWYVNSV